jgi:tRNA-splicing ligase RtcB (3'-phosphate/5'-hydroxy nucleic acid ligase)
MERIGEHQVPEQLTDRLWNWASILEWNTKEQAITTSKMDFIYPHMALMPDAHLGMGSTVGSVVPTLHCLMPSTVGVDIGCGMIAIQTQFTIDDLSPYNLRSLREEIEKQIPMHLGGYNESLDSSFVRLAVQELEALPGADDAYEVSPRWPYQLKSLGTGNHFIEVSTDENGMVWLFLHSGSRGVGNRLATKHIRIAKDLCEAKKIHLPNKDLAYFDEADPEFWDYITDVRWAQHFAFLNRQAMMGAVMIAFSEWIGEPVHPQHEINCHHNYTVQETHYGKKVWVTRKGAINAELGTEGLIPGSMSDASFVVEGKGDERSLNSAPHGAGRPFSRGEAKRQFTMEELELNMEGIEWRHSRKLVDEISGAYKPIKKVMEDAEDLVTIKHELHQILNVKGD